MNMKEFYENYIPREYLAKLMRTSTHSLYKYERGEYIREDTKNRIERAIQIIKEYDLKWSGRYKVPEKYGEKGKYDYRGLEVIRKEMDERFERLYFNEEL